MHIDLISKEELSAKAIEHTKQMNLLYRNDINNSIKHSYIRKEKYFFREFENDKFPKNIEFCNLSIVDALFCYFYKLPGNVCIINPTTYSDPCSNFIKGYSSQEDIICHHSYLYNVLSANKFSFQYNYNRSHKNHKLYINWCIYSTDIMFNKNEDYIYCDVLSCTPVTKPKNKEDAITYRYSYLLEDRFDFMFNIAKEKNADNIIIGPFGVDSLYKNKASTTAIAIRDALYNGHYSFENVVFAIQNKETLETFKKIIKRDENNSC